MVEMIVIGTLGICAVNLSYLLATDVYDRYTRYKENKAWKDKQNKDAQSAAQWRRDSDNHHEGFLKGYKQGKEQGSRFFCQDCYSLTPVKTVVCEPCTTKRAEQTCICGHEKINQKNLEKNKAWIKEEIQQGKKSKSAPKVKSKLIKQEPDTMELEGLETPKEVPAV